MLVSFRPTWRQAVACGLCPGALGGLALALTAMSVPVVLETVVGRSPYPPAPPHVAWVVVFAPLSVGALGGLVLGRRPTIRVHELGVHCGPPGPNGFAPWQMVVDIRAERRRCRTAVTLYLDDGSALRLRAPYDGRLLGRDPQFERKLFMIRHLWETHRNWTWSG